MADDAAIAARILDAQAILTALGFPAAQSNVRSALTLLALCDLPPDKGWGGCDQPSARYHAAYVIYGDQLRQDLRAQHP